MAIVLCASLMTSPIIGEPDQTDFTEQQSTIGKCFNNTYNAIKTDIISIIALIKNNPVKSFLAVATLMVIVGSIQHASALTQDRTEDEFFEIQLLLKALDDRKFNNKLDEIAFKLGLLIGLK